MSAYTGLHFFLVSYYDHIDAFGYYLPVLYVGKVAKEFK